MTDWRALDDATGHDEDVVRAAAPATPSDDAAPVLGAADGRSFAESAPGAADGRSFAESVPGAADGRSFAERFRGTPWGSPAEPSTGASTAAAAASTTSVPADTGSAADPDLAPDGDPQQPAGPGAGPRSGAGPLAVVRRLVPNRLTGAGILLLGASLVAGIVLALGGGALVGAPVATDALPRVTGTPDPAAGRAAIDGFLAAVARKGLAYEVRVRGATTLGGVETEVRVTGKVAGRNMDLRYVLQRSAGAPVERRVVVVGSKVWSQAGDAATWRRLKARPASLPDVAALGGLTDPAQLAHVDSGYRRGYRTEHLRTVPGWVSPMTSRVLAPWPEAIVRESVLDLWVLPDGRPVEIAYRFEALLPATPAYGSVAGTRTFVYDRFGEKVTVAPPK